MSLAALAREGRGGEALCADTVRAVRREAENEANEAIHDVRADQSGMLPCLRHGFWMSLSFSMASERQMRLRASFGMITSSIKPRAPATKGLANFDLYSASRSASLAGSFFSSRKIISPAPFGPITAITANGQARLTAPRRCLDDITS